MTSSISTSRQKALGLFGIFKKKDQGAEAAMDPKMAAAMSKLPSLAVPRENPSAAGILPIWDLLQDDSTGLGIIVMRDGSYRSRCRRRMISRKNAPVMPPAAAAAK